MGLFAKLRRSRPAPNIVPVMREYSLPQPPPGDPPANPPPNQPPQPAPDALRRELFQAAAAGDEEKLVCLCQTHEKAILENGAIWSKAPPGVRGNPAVLRWYAQGLQAISRFCADRLEKPKPSEPLHQLESRLEGAAPQLPQAPDKPGS